jgi:uncharacterized protein (DUF1015 family)
MEVKAFKGYRFDPAVVGDPGKCIAPPYDVVDDKMRDELYKANPYNIIRITRGKTTADDSEQDNQYTRAGQYLETFIAEGALKQDDQPMFYAYVQDFTIAGQVYRRSGFVGLGKLEEFGSGVQPHEKTLSGPKADRLKLFKAKAANLGQIFMLYDDPEKVADTIIEKAAKNEALIEFTDDTGVSHKLYPINDAGDIGKIEGIMADKTTTIADGHHRYETALNYYRETANPAAAYRMMTFVNMRNSGLVVLPTHRLVKNLENIDFDSMLDKINENFDVKAYPYLRDEDKETVRKSLFEEMTKLFDKGRHAFGLYANNGAFYLLLLKDISVMNKALPDASEPARALDVNVLHKLILENILAIGDKQLASESNLTYIKDIGDAIFESINKIDSGQAQMIFFMNPTRVDQVSAVAAQGEKMPQKSTFFYPKIYTGLVINKLSPVARKAGK